MAISGGIALLTVSGLSGGFNFWSNTYHYLVDDPSDDVGFTVMQRLLSAWDTHNKSDFLDCIATDTGLRNISARLLTPQTSPTASMALDDLGTREGPTGCVAVGAQIAWFDDSGTGRTGKTYMPGPGQLDIVDDQPSVGYTAAVDSFAITQKASISNGGSDFTPVIASKDLHLVGNIVAYAVRIKPGIQKRRLLPSHT